VNFRGPQDRSLHQGCSSPQSLESWLTASLWGGQPPLVAAAEMRLTRDQVYKIMRGAAYRRESVELFALVGNDKKGVVAEATLRLCELLHKAVDTTDRILGSGTDDAVALRAANSVFDRTGLSAPRRADEEQTRASIVLTVEQSAALLDALRVASAMPVIETEKKEEEEEDEEDDDSDTEGEERKPSEQDDEGDEDQEDEEPWRT
jgi:hypothetical protein